MKLVADESIEGPSVYALRKAGHEVLFIAEFSPGIEDSTVLEIASREDALLLTADKDFGELVFRNGQTHSGVLLIRSLDSSAPIPAAERRSGVLRCCTSARVTPLHIAFPAAPYLSFSHVRVKRGPRNAPSDAYRRSARIYRASDRLGACD